MTNEQKKKKCTHYFRHISLHFLLFHISVLFRFRAPIWVLSARHLGCMRHSSSANIGNDTGHISDSE